MGLTIVLVLLLPRKWAIVPFLCFTFLTPLAQEFYVGGVHLFALRIVILCGCFRLLASSLTSDESVLAGGVNGIDRAFLWLALVQQIGFVLIYRESGAAINAAGGLWDFVGGYLIVRYFIRER